LTSGRQMLFWLSTKSSLHLYQYEHAYQHLSSVLAGNILVSYCTMHCGCGESFNSSNRASKDLHLVGASMPVIGVHAWGKVAHFVTPFNYDNLEENHAALNGFFLL
ncbi:hypothetical protein D0Y65_033722, partial [Glycine soja]